MRLVPKASSARLQQATQPINGPQSFVVAETAYPYAQGECLAIALAPWTVRPSSPGVDTLGTERCNVVVFARLVVLVVGMWLRRACCVCCLALQPARHLLCIADTMHVFHGDRPAHFKSVWTGLSSMFIIGRSPCQMILNFSLIMA